MFFVGIDPGKSGALACIDETGKFHSAFAKMNAPSLLDWIGIQYNAHIRDGLFKFYVERAQAFPKNGAAGMFNYGMGYGEILGILQCCKVKYELITPKVWTKEMLKDIPKDAEKDKNRNIQVAYELFPDFDFRASFKCKKPHLGLVDAFLIAEYGRIQHERASDSIK